MGVAVYPRLAELLQAKNLTVADVERRIAQRFGLTVDPKALQRLTYAEPLHRTDLETAAAAAVILGVSLGDMFDVEAIPIGAEEGVEVADLGPDESRRMAELLDQQARRGLAPDEYEELRGLVAEYGRRVRERLLLERARSTHESLDEARDRSDGELRAMLESWQAQRADADWRRRVATQRRRRRAPRSTEDDE